MNKSLLLFVSLTFVAWLFPPVLLGQSEPPPPCCKNNRIMVEPGGESPKTNVPTSSMYASDSLLQSLGLTRTQFLDRMSDVFFPDKQVDLVITTARTANPRSVPNQRARQIPDSITSTEEGLLAVRETRFYQIPKYRLPAERLENLDQLYLTDGQAYISITFFKNDPSDPERSFY